MLALNASFRIFIEVRFPFWLPGRSSWDESSWKLKTSTDTHLPVIYIGSKFANDRLTPQRSSDLASSG